MKESDGGGLKIGLGMNQHLLQRQVESSYAYVNETGQQKTGIEVVEALLALWQETEFVSVDFPVSDMDIAGLRHLKKVRDFMYALCLVNWYFNVIKENYRDMLNRI